MLTNTLNLDKVRDKISSIDSKAIEDKLQMVLKWIENENRVEKEECENKKKIEDIANPKITQIDRMSREVVFAS